MGLTGIYNSPVAEEDGMAIIKEAFNSGITFFDTADIYGVDNASEYLVGKVKLLKVISLLLFCSSMCFVPVTVKVPSK